MRIGLVCPYSFEAAGGVQNHVLGLAGWLQSNGHDVALLAPGFPDGETISKYGLRVEQFTSAGRPLPVAINGSIARVVVSLPAWRRGRRWLQEGSFDVVHIHEPFIPGIGLIINRLATTPVIGTFHSSHKTLPWLRRAHETLNITRDLDAAIAVSREAANVASHHYGVDPVIIGNGVDESTHSCEPTTTQWRAGSEPLITFIGRYDEPRKGFDVFVDAIASVRRQYPEVSVTVVGQGKPRYVDGMRFVGGVDDERRNTLLARSDVYVAPHTGNESFGIVLIEALASGAPVVASDLAAFVDVLTDDDGIVGHIAPAGDAQGLADAILASLAEPRDLRLERGIKRAHDFDWEQIAPQIVALYSKSATRDTRPESRIG